MKDGEEREVFTSQWEQLLSSIFKNKYTYSAIKYNKSCPSSEVPMVLHENSRNVCFRLVGQKKYKSTHSVTTILSFDVCVFAVALSLHGMPFTTLQSRQTPKITNANAGGVNA